jgi:hypothetical protein
MITPTERIGMKWAKTISRQFVLWAAQEKKSRSIKIKPFDPTPQITLAFYESGAAQLEDIGKLIGMGVNFDLKSPNAIAWIKEYSASQIKYIGDAQKLAIRQIKMRGLDKGLSPQEQIKLIKQHIGLLPQHVVAVDTYRQGLLDSGMDQISVERLADKYRAKLLTYRANMIAVTEGMTAANEGNRETNRSAVERGIIDPDEYEQQWIASGLGNICDDCDEANGTRADIDGTFPNGTIGPPLHPHCHCNAILTKRK